MDRGIKKRFFKMMPTSATFSEIRMEIYRQEIVAAQRIVARIALRELGYCEADMTRYLRVTTSCIYRSVSPGKRPKVTVYIKWFCTFCTNVPYCLNVLED
jgi:hypothetical protein